MDAHNISDDRKSAYVCSPKNFHAFGRYLTMLDYSIYFKHPDAFSAQSFEQYCSSIGLHVKLYPSFNLLKDTGFLPIRLIDERFATNEGNHDFLSGFELYLSEYHHVIQSKEEEKGFFKKMFKTKPAPELPFDRAVKDTTWRLWLRCGMSDSFEMLLAYVFGAYFVKFCGGVFDDPQTGQFYDNFNHLESDIAEIIAALQELKTTDELLTHKFDGWK